jgi:hypothetical protein
MSVHLCVSPQELLQQILMNFCIVGLERKLSKFNFGMYWSVITPVLKKN